MENDTSFQGFATRPNDSNPIFHENSTLASITDYPATQLLICSQYVVIFILGIFGNCLVCHVVFRNKQMHTVTNYFIANLALADILLCILAVPFTPIYFFLKRWPFGDVMCTLVSMSQSTSVYVSTLTLTSIAIDRYFVIIHPFRPKMRISVCYAIILGIWLTSITASIPYALYISQELYKNVYYCEEFWPSEFIRKVFSSVTTIFQFFVPFVIISFCYLMISIRMNQRLKANTGGKGSRKELNDRKKQKRTNKMVIGMVAIFGVCWFPVNLIHLIGDYFAHTSNTKYYNTFFFVSHIIAMSSTCYNPFLYAWLNENFRREFQQVLPFCANKKRCTLRGSQRTQLNNSPALLQDIETIEPATRVTGCGVDPKKQRLEDNIPVEPAAIVSRDENALHLSSELLEAATLNAETNRLSPIGTNGLDSIETYRLSPIETNELSPNATNGIELEEHAFRCQAASTPLEERKFYSEANYSEEVFLKDGVAYVNI